MPAVTRTATGVGPTRPVVLDPFQDPFNVSLFGVSSGGANVWKVEVTGDDPTLATDALGTGLTWFDHATLVGITGNSIGNLAFPVRAIRLNCTNFVSGQVVLTAIQAGKGGA